MRNWILGLLLLVGGTISAQQTVHHVEAGETLYGISKTYNVSIESILDANPILKEGLKEGQEIVIPNARLVEVDTDIIPMDESRFDYYTVKPKETIFSLTREWGISYDKLLELNPELTDGLKVDQVLSLPEGTLGVQEDPRSAQGYIPYTVRPKQTIFSLVRELNWTEVDLYRVNPNIRIDGLKAGSEIWIPDNADTQDWLAQWQDTDSTRADSAQSIAIDIADQPEDTASIVTTEDTAVEKKVQKYKVVQVERGQDWSDIISLYQTPKDELIRLNPELVNGVRAGRYIIVPNIIESKEPDTVNVSGIAWDSMTLERLLAEEEIKIAVALPLYLEENDSMATAYQMGEMSPKIFPRSRIAYDFYSGLKMAMDTLTAYGLDIEVKIFDTRNDLVRIREITAEIVEDGDYDLVIGPLYSANAEEMARYAPQQWIVSPLSRTVNNQNRPKLIQAVAPISAEHLAIARYVNEHAQDANLVFVRRDLESEEKSIQRFTQYLEASPDRNVSQLVMGEDLFNAWSVRSKLAAGKQDVFVILDDDPVLMTSFVNSAASVGDSTLSMITTSRLLGMNTLEIEKLNRLNVCISEIENIDYRSEATNTFLRKYRDEMNTEPPRFAYHGYDIGIYFIPLFAPEFGPEVSPWAGNQGITKMHRFTEDPSRGPTNGGVVMLKLHDFTWSRIY